MVLCSLYLPSRAQRIMTLWSFCYEILIPQLLWPEKTETNSQSISFQEANLGQIQDFHLLCKIYKLWNPGNRVLYFVCKGKRLQCCSREAPELHALHTKDSSKGISAFFFALECMNSAPYCWAPGYKLLLKKGRNYHLSLGQYIYMYVYLVIE